MKLKCLIPNSNMLIFERCLTPNSDTLKLRCLTFILRCLTPTFDMLILRYTSHLIAIRYFLREASNLIAIHWFSRSVDELFELTSGALCNHVHVKYIFSYLYTKDLPPSSVPFIGNLCLYVYFTKWYFECVVRIICIEKCSLNYLLRCNVAASNKIFKCSL